MSSKTRENRISALEIALEEAIQMLRLVAANKRTCLEIEEWLSANHPEKNESSDVVKELLKIKK